MIHGMYLIEYISSVMSYYIYDDHRSNMTITLTRCLSRFVSVVYLTSLKFWSLN